MPSPVSFVPSTTVDPVRLGMLSVVIPTFNESHRLPRTLQEIYGYLQNRFPRFEILVVDDASPDGTGTLVAEFAQRHPETRLVEQGANFGKGAAVRRGCLEARGDLVLFIDADHSTPIESLDAFLPEVQPGVAMAVVGVRTYQDDESRLRRIIGLIGQLMAHIIVFRRAVVDSQCGFKLFTREAVQKLFPLARVNGGMLDVELFYLMHLHDVPCRAVPVLWANKPGSRINIPLCLVRDPLDMLRIRLRNFMGGYRTPIPAERQPWATTS